MPRGLPVRIVVGMGLVAMLSRRTGAGGTAPEVRRAASFAAPPMGGTPIALDMGSTTGTPAPAPIITIERETAQASGVYEVIDGADESFVPGASEYWRKLRALVRWVNAAGDVTSTATSLAVVVPAPSMATAPFLEPDTAYQSTDESTPITAQGQTVRRVSDPNGGVPVFNAASTVTWSSLGGLVHAGTTGVLSALGRTTPQDDTLYLFVVGRTSADATLYHTHGSSSTEGLEIEAESSGRIRTFNNNVNGGTLTTATDSFPVGEVSSIAVARSNSNFVRRVYAGGAIVTDTGDPPLGTVLDTFIGADAGTSAFFEGTYYHVAEYTGAELDFSDDGKLDLLVAWGDALRDAVIAAQIVIDFPATLATFQRQSNSGGGLIRARGTCSAKRGASGIEARWNGGAWVDCVVGGNEWSVEYVAPADGTGDLEVRYKTLAHTASVEAISVGLVYGGTGQSNMFGSTDNFSDKSAHTPQVAIYERRYDGQAAMYPGASNNGWNRAESKAFAPEFLAQRATSTGSPCALVRCAIGSTRISFWLSDGTVNPDFSNQTPFDAFVRALCESQGLDPDTYDPVTGPKLCEFVLQQIGETDAAVGTSKANWEARITAFATDIHAKTGAPVYLSALQELPASYADPLDLDDIQQGVSDAVAAEAAAASSEGRAQVLYAGPSFVGVDLIAGGSSDGVHWQTDTQLIDLATAWEQNTPDTRP